MEKKYVHGRHPPTSQTCILLAVSQVWMRGGQACRHSQHSPLALIPLPVDLQYPQSFKQWVKTAHHYRGVEKRWISSWPYDPGASVAWRAWETGKFQLDTDQESTLWCFYRPCGANTALELEENVWCYGKGCDSPATGQADRFKWSKSVKCYPLWRGADVMPKKLTEFKNAGLLNPNTTHPHQLKQTPLSPLF